MTSRTLKLSEISKNASRSFDYRKNPSVVFVNTGDVLEGEFLHSNITDTKKVKLPGQAKKAIKKGDILYSEIRPGNKRYVYIDKDLDNYVVSTKFMVIESNEEIVDSKFLYYCLTENKCEETFKAIADSRSGTFPQITFDSIAFYEFTIPSKDEQKAFVYIADNIANKIRNNNKINQHLESLAQTIFKSWFVDFDPVHAKKNALEAGLTKAQAERSAIAVIAGLCSPTEYADNIKEIEKKLEERLASIGKEKAEELKATASLFPSVFEESELGYIPKGWGIKNLGDIVTRLKPKNKYTKENTKNAGKTIVFEQGEKIILGFTDEEADFKATSKEPMFVFGDHTCIMKLWSKPFSISSNVIPLMKNDYPAHWTFYACLGKQNFQEYRRHWMEFVIKKTVVPNNELPEIFSKLVLPLQQLYETNFYEINTLAELRDYLLPKLLSGEIDLNGVQID